MTKLHKELHYFYQLLMRLILAIFIFGVVRFVFYLVYQSFFQVESTLDLIQIFLYAIRFDLAALTYVNALLILSYLLPFSFRKNATYQKMQLGLFLGFNIFALAFEVADIAYFQYALRRSIFSDFILFKNALSTTPGFLLKFWFLIPVTFFTFGLLYYLYKKTSLREAPEKNNIFAQLFIFVLGVGLTIIAARGGLQLRPVMPLTAANYVKDMKHIPLMTNTSLSMIFSLQQRIVKDPQYFSDTELNEHFPVYKMPTPDSTFKAENIFIIILESFGKEFISSYNDFEGPTPFLDSLVGLSNACALTYANGQRSTQGIVAISAGIPSLMEDPLMFSAYQSNIVEGLAGSLKKKGYQSTFFHGANPGSMEFSRFSKIVGFDNYVDRTGYPDDSHYDGSWGIWDDPFFQFAVTETSKVKQPFFAQLFSLTSHHPFAVEDWFAEKYPEENHVTRSFRYTDYALKHFFETAAKQDWYNNTLFIITADHVPGSSIHADYNTKVGRYKVPILFFHPQGKFPKIHSNVMQHIDIQPTVLDYLNYDLPFTKFGHSIFDEREHHYCYMFDGVYQIMDDQCILLFDGQETLAMYDYQNDVQLTKDIKHDLPKVRERLELRIRAVIQQHHQAMINNRLVQKVD